MVLKLMNWDVFFFKIVVFEKNVFKMCFIYYYSEVCFNFECLFLVKCYCFKSFKLELYKVLLKIFENMV